MEPTHPIELPPPPPPPPDNQHHDKRSSMSPTHAFTERVLRALGHRLLLLYRADPNFYVLGATGNVYVVNVTTSLACTCPDRATPCKHILFVLIKVLGVPLDEPCLRKRTLRSSQVAQLLASPSSPDSLASLTLRQRFHQAFFLQREPSASSLVADEGATCPICLDEMGKSGERLVSCGTCKNFLHEDCLKMWKRTQRRRSFSCVICRSRWRNWAEQEKYLNLAAYVSEDDDHMAPETAESSNCRE